MAVGLCEAGERLGREQGSTAGSKPWESKFCKKHKAARSVSEEAQRADSGCWGWDDPIFKTSRAEGLRKKPVGRYLLK